jgi:hypothetical protein
MTAESSARRKTRGRGFPGYKSKISCEMILHVIAEGILEELE